MSDESLAPHRGSRRAAAVTVAAVLPALLYLLYISRYAVNIPIFDDWSSTRVASRALHGQLTFGDLWVQHGDTRLFTVQPVFAAFGRLDHLNYKHVTFFSAGTYIAAFAMLLLLLRRYLGRPLTALPVLVLGIVWFSVADVDNSVWSFQLGWYMVVFFFVAMTYLLLIRSGRPNLFFALGTLAAVLAAYTEIQGFVVWPVGLICLIWARPWGRRTYYESAIWISTAVVTTAIYVHGYDFDRANSACVLERGTKESCSFTYGLAHPIALVKFLAAMVGNVVPSTPGTWIGLHEILGLVLAAAAVFVVVASLRERRDRRIPLPLVLIAFAFCFDLMIALSRVGQGVTGATRNWYTMPNLILLSGIVVFATGRISDFRSAHQARAGRARLMPVVWVTLLALIAVQCVVATRFGVNRAAVRKDYLVAVAHIMVNQEKIPEAKRQCYVTYAAGVFGFLHVADLVPFIDTAEADQLTFLRRGTLARYRAEGPPRYAPCDGQ